ncbi:adenylyl cyclase alpha, putative [Plasmodium ovale wallikeri]|uniref:Adenylyl cyclase alpha, putative n=1 Tax=Plasmodium ovale wallikeri TaxID=864142 RepID=A0A1A8ZTA0_PLAOA|nr:adenylyl cyclase alpha, putative [Plasmodium ovale wallikeri]SBT47101.1 adenylyl cyclase alpha, putative [Plasmodium ovale wallikeri]
MGKRCTLADKYLGIGTKPFRKFVSFLYLFLVIFSKDLLSLLLEKERDFLLDLLVVLLILCGCIEIVFHLLMETSYIFDFMFFDIISLILLFWDLFICESYLFDLICASMKKVYDLKQTNHAEVFYLLQLFKALRVTKMYRLAIEFIRNHTKEKYKHRNEWNFEKMESMQNRADLKESLKFTNKMHLALIKRYFMSLFFVMLSYILIEAVIMYVNESKSQIQMCIIAFDDYYESEFLKALYFYSTIKKSRNDAEYLISFKSKRKLKNFMNKKEINIGEGERTLWDFANLPYNEVVKFINMNPSSGGQNDEEEIVLDSTIKNLDELRHYEMMVYESRDFTFYISIKRSIEKNIKNAIILKILIILFSFVILFYFSSELNILLFPIESILKKLKLMKSNPTLALEMQEELLNHELDNILRNTKLKRNGIKGNYEILKMEENLMKLGTLMLLGFGEAGAKIISKNINEQERINLLINGEVVYSVFSFCDIRNFTEITETLKEKIMIFINLVAEIIHECCDFYGGSINKNIGDAFLLVWKCKKGDFSKKNQNSLESKYCMREDNSYDDISEKENIRRICDLAFLSTVQTLIRLQQSEKIRAFLKNEKIDDLIDKSALELSFGLHFGWAIEGAIGSSYKIDLSYLSENVNIASRLQDISKIYKSNIVISGDFYDNMSENFKIQKERTVHIFETFVTPPCADRKMIKILDDIKKKTQRRRRKKEVSNLTYDLYAEYARSNDVKSVRVHFPGEYLTLFENALELYLSGNWRESKITLDYLKNKFSIDDYIVYQLLDFMNTSNFIAPSDWCGYRRFLQKS